MPGYIDGAKANMTISNQETQICGEKVVNDEFSSPPSQPAETEKKSKRKIQESSEPKDKKQSKKDTDKKYRDRLKNKKIETERELEILREENAHLNREIESLQSQDVTKNQILQSKDEQIQQLKKAYGQLKQNYEERDIIVKALTKQLANSRDANLQHENTQLKCTIAKLQYQINNQDKAADIIQREEKIAELEEQNKVLEIVVTALSEKMKNDEHSVEESELFLMDHLK